MSRLERLISRVIKAHARLITDKDIDLQHQLQIQATRESIEFINDNMHDIMIFENRNGIRNYYLNNITIDGLFLEFGVFEGDSINLIAKKFKNKTIHGFDSFEGLPQDWDGSFYDKEYFNLKGELPKVEKNVILHKGWFEDTIPEFIKSNKDNIAFLHIDCDLYSSTKTVFDLIGNRIQKGTIIQFDEFLNTVNWKKHEYKAFSEFVEKNNVKFDYLAVDGNGRVCVRIK